MNIKKFYIKKIQQIMNIKKFYIKKIKIFYLNQ